MVTGLKMLWRRVTGRRRCSAAEWAAVCAEIDLLQRYRREECERLRNLVGDFLNNKAIEGAGGLEVTDEMRRLISVQACVPILNLGLDHYKGWYSVVVYPGEFRVPYEYVDMAGVVHKTSRDLSGESWHRGPVILSWQHTEDGARGLDATGNLVIHEFAHKLDLLNGKANGMPPLHADMDRRAWTNAFTAAFEDFQERINSARALPFNAYGGVSPGEFFAVASEAFFVNPQAVYSAYPEVYRMLRQFYRQDPR